MRKYHPALMSLVTITCIGCSTAALRHGRHHDLPGHAIPVDPVDAVEDKPLKRPTWIVCCDAGELTVRGEMFRLAQFYDNDGRQMSETRFCEEARIDMR